LRTIGAKLRPGRPKIEPPPKLVVPFYRQPEWREFSAGMLRARGRMCYDPEHPAGVPRHGHRIFCDHITELKDGGAPFDPKNILLRCSSCHVLKTNRERARRYQARPVP
jgi:5-methylcytosine-specific restriction enzyme A